MSNFTAFLCPEFIYIFGGYDGHCRYPATSHPTSPAWLCLTPSRSNDLFLFNYDKKKWLIPEQGEISEVELVPSRRQRHITCNYGSRKLFIFGGFSGNRWLSDAYIFHVDRLIQNTIKKEVTNDRFDNRLRLIEYEKDDGQLHGEYVQQERARRLPIPG